MSRRTRNAPAAARTMSVAMVCQSGMGQVPDEDERRHGVSLAIAVHRHKT
jgi:hypothetical protein